MRTTYKVEGMTCGGCQASVQKHLNTLPGVSAEVSLDRQQAIIQSNKPLDLADLQAVLPEKFTIDLPAATSTSIPVEDQPNRSKWQQLKPLFLLIGYITVGSLLANRSTWSIDSIMLDFMGLFFIVFSFFKMLDLRRFPISFRMYDPLAKAVPAYAVLYPFIETVLGLAFLLRFQVQWALWATLVVLTITTVGVIRTLVSKKKIACACLGTALKLPMTLATFIENALMIGMAVAMLISL